MAKIIGFGHRSRMGKDTCADFAHGYIRQHVKRTNALKISFAAKMKAMCHDLFGWDGLREAQYYEDNPLCRDIKLPTIGMTPVEIWIAFGTNVGRSIFQDTWLRYALEKPCDYLIISDVRFPNEADAILDRGGHVFKVHNPRVALRESVADQALEGYKHWSDTIVNDAGLKELNHKVIAIVKELL